MSHGPANDDLSFRRVYDAPRELVFRCMVDPEHLTHFWGPMGVSTPLQRIKVDLRPGGVFQAVMVNDGDGSEYSMRVEYLEIEEPVKLVWSDMDTGVVTTSTFVALDDARTELVIRQSKVPAAFRAPEAQAGFLSSLDRFAAYLGQLHGEAAGSIREVPR